MSGTRDYYTMGSKIKTNIWYQLYMESEKKCYKWAYLENRNRLIDIENKLIATKGKRGGGRIN